MIDQKHQPDQQHPLYQPQYQPPFNQPPRPPKKPWYRVLPWWFWVVLVVLVTIIVAVNNSEVSKVSQQSQTQPTITTLAVVVPQPTQTPYIIVATSNQQTAIPTNVVATQAPSLPTTLATIIATTVQATPILTTISAIATVAPSVTSKPSPLTAIPPTEVKATVAQPIQSLASQGVGLTKAEWEALKGPPNPQYLHTDERATYQGNTYQVYYEEGKVWSLTIQFEKKPITLSDAKKLAQVYMPTDAKYIKTYQDKTGEPVLVYQSNSIIPRFASNLLTWDGPDTIGQMLVFLTSSFKNPEKIIDIDIVVGSEEDLNK